MKLPTDFNPYGLIAAATPFELRPFDFSYEDGVEVFSVIVPEVREPTVARIAAGTPESIDLLAVPKHAAANPTSLLTFHVCSWLRREYDFPRCSLGMRVRDDQRIEVRVRFQPPWWWDLEKRIRELRREGVSSP